MSYTIMEYDLLTGECETIGQATGDDSGVAKARFKEKNNYQPRKWVWLIARGPFY